MGNGACEEADIGVVWKELKDDIATSGPSGDSG